MSYLLSDYNFPLAESRIAQHPIVPAHSSKLLSVDCTGKNLSLSDHRFFDLPDLLEPGTLLIANNSQVFASRIIVRDVEVFLKNGTQTTLAYGELLIVRVLFDDEGNLDTKRCVVWFSDKKHCRPGCRIVIPTEVEESFIVVDKGSFDSTSLAQDDKKEVNIIIHSKEFLDDGILIELEGTDLITLCEQYGDMPLPPYITQASAEDKIRYKTSFGQQIGSVATPTAGLHFTPELRQKLQHNHISWAEITLHVGIGTFAPVVSHDIREHQLHAEYITIDISLFETIYRQKISNKPIITIGTTTTRTIESLPYLFFLIRDDLKNKLSDEVWVWRNDHSLDGGQQYISTIHSQSDKIFFSSSLFIYPGFQRQLIDGIVTNFHLPGTSLVMLVAGLIGYDNRKQCYDYALAKSPEDHYRWASFGDGMLIQL